MKNSLYETDYYAWSNQQAALLRAGQLSDADIENIAEEIESMGKSEKRELVSRLRVLLTHLLKWQYQPKRRGVSWEATIVAQRNDIVWHLEDNPSLTAQLSDTIARAYIGAASDATVQTRLSPKNFPKACPWSYEQMISPDFWPD
jgi:Domain of unknown function DUF29